MLDIISRNNLIKNLINVNVGTQYLRASLKLNVPCRRSKNFCFLLVSHCRLTYAQNDTFRVLCSDWKVSTSFHCFLLLTVKLPLVTLPLAILVVFYIFLYSRIYNHTSYFELYVMRSSVDWAGGGLYVCSGSNAKSDCGCIRQSSYTWNRNI